MVENPDSSWIWKQVGDFFLEANSMQGRGCRLQKLAEITIAVQVWNALAQVSLQMPSSSSDSSGQMPHRKANFTKLAEPLSSCGLQFMPGLLGNKRKLAAASSPRCFASSPGRAGTPNVSLADFEIVERDRLPYTATCGTSFRSWCHSQFGQNYTMPPRSSWFQSYLCKLFAR